MKQLFFFLAFCFFLVEKGVGLKCYDSVSTNGSVLIGCNFPGAACGVTHATYIHPSIIPYTVQQTYEVRSYFCAHKETTCKTGVGNQCSKTANVMLLLGLVEDKKCTTTCCETDKCNKMPEETDARHHIIGKLGSLDKIDRDAQVQSPLRCFVNVNKGEQMVDCLFHDAVCVLYKKQTNSPTEKGYSFGNPFTSTTYYEAFQRCGKKSECIQGKKTLCETKFGTPISNCVYQCCTSNSCNRLPPSMQYVDDPTQSQSTNSGGQKKKTKNADMNLGYEFVATTAMTADSSVVGSGIDLSANSPHDEHVILIVCVSGVGFAVTLVSALLFQRHRARKRWSFDEPPLLG